MFEALHELMNGFSVALQPENLFFALCGCLIGMCLGVLPGVGQSTGIAILIPVTYFIAPAGAIIMLAAIFYGAMYGGTISAVLLNVPGESEAVATTFDGHPLARQGRAGAALSIAAIGSFIGGVSATMVLVFFAKPLSKLAIAMGPPEYLLLMLLGLSLIVALVGADKMKGLSMAAVGLVLAQIGLDPVQGVERLTFGDRDLLDGLPLLAVILALFGLSDVFLQVAGGSRGDASDIQPLTSLYPTREDLRISAAPIARGTVIGTLLGLIPGMIASMSSFTSYVVEKGVSKDKSRFGRGAMEGVAGPETANNAFGNAAFIPLLTLGIPGSAAIAILLAAFKIYGLTPGPQLFREQPDIAWGLIASMLVGNAILLILALPLVRIWVGLLRVPSYALVTAVLCLSIIGVYSQSGSIGDLYLLIGIGMVAAMLKSAGYPMAPAILAFVLGSNIESALRQTVTISDGDVVGVITRPGVLSIAGGVAVAVTLFMVWRHRRSSADAQLFRDSLVEED